MGKSTPTMGENLRTYRLEEDGRTIFANPIETKHEGGSSFTLGFPVCEVKEFIKTPEAVVELLNRGEHFPNLFEALETVLPHIGVGYSGKQRHELLEKARAVLAKATGDDNGSAGT